MPTNPLASLCPNPVATMDRSTLLEHVRTIRAKREAVQPFSKRPSVVKARKQTEQSELNLFLESL